MIKLGLLILTLLFTQFHTICSAQNLTKIELCYILERTKNKEIIGLGESEHFYRGYYDSKIQIIKYLIKEKAINTLALEASLNVTAILDKYINGEIIDNIPKILTALNEPYSLQNVGLFNCREFMEFLDWLKQYNLTNDVKIKLVGFDFQNYSIPLEALKPQSSQIQKKLITDTKVLLEKSMQAILDSNIMIITSPEWIVKFKKAKENVRELKFSLYTNETKYLFQELEQFTTLWDHPMFPRDSMMFENLIKQIDKKSKVLVWAHNFHIENDSSLKGVKKLGVYLKENFDDRYFIMSVSDQASLHKSKNITSTGCSNHQKFDLIINTLKGEKCEIIN